MSKKVIKTVNPQRLSRVLHVPVTWKEGKRTGSKKTALSGRGVEKDAGFLNDLIGDLKKKPLGSFFSSSLLC
ncbi:hypothetical protein Csa_010251 [Cucumis sativus]|uniref:Uncharacterized protein n=1 Tax=Cucumis sativus TaxID=3659 RepID=A0A0A0L1V8_CUCSA|nr:hypothetical protein Csa_010251 [Cucumis sativus]